LRWSCKESFGAIRRKKEERKGERENVKGKGFLLNTTPKRN